jgi:hypothetical protein
VHPFTSLKEGAVVSKIKKRKDNVGSLKLQMFLFVVLNKFVIIDKTVVFESVNVA